MMMMMMLARKILVMLGTAVLLVSLVVVKVSAARLVCRRDGRAAFPLTSQIEVLGVQRY